MGAQLKYKNKNKQSFRKFEDSSFKDGTLINK